MAGAIYIPGANRTAQWFYGDYPGTEMPRIRKLLLHTTEGGGWPAYSGGSEAPQATYDPSKHQWRQHLPLNRSGRALVDPSSTAVRENRDEVVQVEIVCSCDPAYAKKHGILYVEDIDDQAIADLGGFLAFMHREWQVPLVKAPLWLPYPRSYGNSAARMSSAEYDAFAGVLGHQHASGNVHGDPGAIPITKIMAAASVGAAGDTEDCEMTEQQAAALLAALGRIETTLNGMNARLGYLANDMAKDVDEIRDVMKPGVDG